MSRNIPLDDSTIATAQVQRTWRMGVESPYGGVYSIDIHRQKILLNAAGAMVGQPERTGDYRITIDWLQTHVAQFPQIQKYAVLPGLLKDLGDDVEAIFEALAAEALEAEKLAAQAAAAPEKSGGS